MLMAVDSRRDVAGWLSAADFGRICRKENFSGRVVAFPSVPVIRRYRTALPEMKSPARAGLVAGRKGGATAF